MVNRENIKLPPDVPPLNTLYAYLTSGCNLACRHCWLSPAYQRNGNTGGHLDLDLFKIAVRDALPLGLGSVKLTGGEPLLHPEFLSIIDHLSENEVKVNIETNGVLLTSDLARHLKDHSSLDFISVSLDGANAETHDAFRGVKGSFDKACEAVRNLASVGMRPQVIMSLHTGNIAEIEDEVRLAIQLGASSVKFNLIHMAGRADNMANRNETLSINKLIKIGNWVEKELQNIVPIQLLYSWPISFQSLRRLSYGNSGKCGILNILGILADGKMAMCGIGVEIEELVYGQLGIDSLQDVWLNNEVLIQLRDDIPNNLEGICGSCIFKLQCLGTCVADNYHQTHKLTAPFWFCQQADEQHLFPNTRIK